MAARNPATWWVALCALLLAGSLATQLLAPQSLDWQPQRALAEPWRWWTAPLVHYSRQHLLANLAACAVVGAFGWAARLPLRWTVAWLAAWPLMQGALLATPALSHYGGLSGLLHAGVAIETLALVCFERGRKRWIGATVFAGLVLKVITEQPWVGPVQHLPEWDIGVVPLAHAVGAVVGVACAAVACATSRSSTMRAIDQ